MNILDKIILKLYLWRFPEKPFELKPIEPIPIAVTTKHEVRTINGVCFVPERPFKNKWITDEEVACRLIDSMKPELARCLGVITTEQNYEYGGVLRVQGSIDVVLSGNDIHFGGF